METDRIRYFCVIAEAGSLTEASKVLGISHSGLSKAMSVLTQETGQTLFRHHGRGLLLTENGKSFYKKGKEILRQIEALKTSLPSQRGSCRIGLSEVFSISFSGAFASALGEGIDLVEQDSGEAERQLLEGRLDFALSFIPFPHSELEYLRIKKVEMGIFACEKKFLSLPIGEIPFVVPNLELPDNPMSLKARDGWPAEISRRSVFGASSLSTALGIVEAGKAAVFMPRFVGEALRRREGVWGKIIEIEKDSKRWKQSSREIFLLKRKVDAESPAMKSAAKIIRSYC